MKIELKHNIKKIFQTFGLEISRYQTSDTYASKYALGYISAKETIHAASKSGLSVGDYLEMIWNQRDNRQIIVDQLRKVIVFHKNIKNICEIGTGAGLYAEKIIEIWKPERYESYEPDKDWAQWLAEKYNVISHDADGKSLCHTQTSSIDLVVANGVFVYLPFLTTYRYFQEIVRVTHDESYVVFDILSEDCFDDITIKSWLESHHIYPCLVCKKYITDFFLKHRFALIGDFFNFKYGAGKSQYLVFKKDSSMTQEEPLTN
ncbi:hypothetical protein BZZ01_23910 [Nostocales cyanobacterium HT-58-2]|nr:hypothetical protein BZZ01_23910 [Nostocales cyanobacterium HT-58-2]